MNKIPNWLRYILAIPFGIICLILGYYIFYFSNRWVASPDSLMMKFCNYIYVNGINAMVLIFAMDKMLPKHQFKFALAVSIFFCSLGLIGLGMSVMIGNITVSNVVGTFLTIAAFIYSCYYTFKEFHEVEGSERELTMVKANSTISQNKYMQLSKLIMDGLGVSTIDEALERSYKFYQDNGIQLDDIDLKDVNKYQTLSRIMMRAYKMDDIDEVIEKVTGFYQKNVNLIKCKVCDKEIPYNEYGTCQECHKEIMKRLEEKEESKNGEL